MGSMLIGSHASASDIVTVSAQTDRLLLSQHMTFRVLPANTSLQQLDINRPDTGSLSKR